MAQLEIKNLTFTYPGQSRPAVKNASLTVADGSFTLLFGETGCGKTTLLRHFKSTLTPKGERSGEVLIDGVSIDDIPESEQNRKIGFVFQSPSEQIVCDRVWHELAYGLETSGLDRDAVRLKTGETASKFGLEPLFEQEISTLSGGQRQLLCLASVMACGPDTLILDEPLSQLDPLSAENLVNTLRSLNEDYGVTVLVCEHRLEKLFPAATAAAVMYDGELVCSSSVSDVAQYARENGELVKLLPSPARIFSLAGLPGAPALTVRDLKSSISDIKLASKSDVKTSDDGSGQELISLKEIYFRYTSDGRDVLKRLDFRLRKGEIYSLFGSNGCGKTTLAHLLSGNINQYYGKIYVNGKKIKGKIHPGDFNVAILPQTVELLFLKESVRDELLSVAGADNKMVTEREAAEMAEKFGLSQMLDRNPFDLSGGERQKLAMAKILLRQPQLIILDEVTRGMDASFKSYFASLLQALRDEGRTILLITHDTEFATLVSSRCGLMFDGAIISEGAPGEFFSSNSFYTTTASLVTRAKCGGIYLESDAVEAIKAGERDEK